MLLCWAAGDSALAEEGLAQLVLDSFSLCHPRRHAPRLVADPLAPAHCHRRSGAPRACGLGVARGSRPAPAARVVLARVRNPASPPRKPFSRPRVGPQGIPCALARPRRAPPAEPCLFRSGNASVVVSAPGAAARLDGVTRGRAHARGTANRRSTLRAGRRPSRARTRSAASPTRASSARTGADDDADCHSSTGCGRR